MKYFYCKVMVKLVRLFCALPFSVLLSAIGLESPNPFVVILVLRIPLFIRYCAIDSARFEDNSKLLVASPVLSVCPSIKMVAFGETTCIKLAVEFLLIGNSQATSISFVEHLLLGRMLTGKA